MGIRWFGVYIYTPNIYIYKFDLKPNLLSRTLEFDAMKHK